MVDALTLQIQELTQKIYQLEETSAYQEDTIDSLNKTMAKQHQEIQQLQTQLRLLSEFLKTLRADMDSGIKLPSEELPPPHY